LPADLPLFCPAGGLRVGAEALAGGAGTGVEGEGKPVDPDPLRGRDLRREVP
jgi:hypothetical protein